MSNISYIKNLTKAEREELLNAVDFEEPMLIGTVLRYPCYREFGKIKTHEHFYEGNEAWLLTREVWQVQRAFNKVDICNMEVVVGDRTYISITMNDFDIFDHRVGQTNDWHKPQMDKIKKLYEFMYKKFGEQYKKDFVKYFNNYSKKELTNLKNKLDDQKKKALDTFDNVENLEKTL